MAGLEQALLNSGADIARTVAEPWSPSYRREQESQKLALQAKQQSLGMAKSREKRQQETFELNQKHTKLAIDDLDYRFNRKKTDDEKKDYLSKQDAAANVISGVGDILRRDPKNGKRQAFDAIKQNPQPLYDSFDNEGDDVLKELLDNNDVEGMSKLIRAIYPTIPAVQKHLRSLETKAVTGGSAFERSNLQAYQNGTISREKYLDNIASYAGTKSGGKLSASQEETKKRNAEKNLLKARDNADDAGKGFSEINRNIDSAINAIESGDTALMDKMATLSMSAIANPRMRAIKAYDIFDGTYGNVAVRVAESLQEFVGGVRSDEQKAKIIKELKTFRDNYTAPGAQKVRDAARRRALLDNQDPYRVVPLVDLADIRSDLRAGRIKNKAEAMKLAKENNFGLQ